MSLTEMINFRVTPEDMEKITLAAQFRFMEQKDTGPMTGPGVSEYLRFLFNQDITRIAEEIKHRRQV